MIRRPCPQVDGLRLLRLVQVGVDGFERAMAADQVFCDVSPLGVHRHAIEAEPDPEQ